MEPASYDASAIKRIRPPEVEVESGQWRGVALTTGSVRYDG